MSAVQLQQALAALGVAGEVVADGALAVVRLPADDRTMQDPATRREALALATRHGFRNLALEVVD